MIRSHASVPTPTFLLALIALGIVFRFQPGWLAVELKSAAAEHDVRPERLSRLVSRAIAVFEPLVAKLTRRGRPPHESADSEALIELTITRALLQVATDVLACMSLRGRRVRELIVGAYERLGSSHSIKQKRFCEALSVSTRTLRYWLGQARRRRSEGNSACPACGCEPSGDGQQGHKPTAEPSARPRPPRRGRFGFDVVLPGTQLGADTTDLSAFGVGLKLVAAQDIGGRDENLFDAVLVDDHECAEHVVSVLTQALEGRAGAQAITDQGTPYLAAATREALEQLGAEHAIQKEGNPTGKATVERAFRTVKDIAQPLLAITDRIAQTIPALCDTAFAKAIATLLITALLRAYQHGARAARAALNARGNADLDELSRRGELSRQRARATEASKRLLLEHLHSSYELSGSRRRFVALLRSYPLAVLHDADKAFRSQAHRDDIRDRTSYFAAIVRRFNDVHQRERARRRRDREQNREHDRQHQEQTGKLAAFRADPIAWLRHGLELIAAQWLPATATLLFGGKGHGLGTLRAALRHIHLLHGRCAGDLARGAMHDFKLAHLDRLGHDGIGAIAALLERQLATLDRNDDCAHPTPAAILMRTGKKPRPPPSSRLPN